VSVLALRGIDPRPRGNLDPGDPQTYSALPYTGRVRLEWSESGVARTVVFDRGFVVGSSPDSEVCLGDPTVSRVHAAIDLRRDGAWLRDLGSLNGTFVQGIQVEAARVPHLARIRVGETQLVLSHVDLSEEVESDLWIEPSFFELVGGSRVMRRLYSRLARVGPSNASVLIGGETGTGKELVARSLHLASPRARRPFVVVDCAALPDQLLDVELFGHAKGAYTGANGARAGAIECADGGTVFLDEVGELPRAMQPKLLRVLEARTVRRLGENEHRPVDVRFISATHRDLPAMVASGEFREDLYFRLGVIPVVVPPLRDRLDDIEVLTNHFRKGLAPLSRLLIERLARRRWAGNVRELRNFVDRLDALGADDALEPESCDDPSPGEPTPRRRYQTAPSLELSAVEALGPYRDFRELWLGRIERHYVAKMLERHGGNVAATAREADLDRTYLHRLIRKHWP
jgi:two-component system response regulator GlrR